MAYDDKTHRHDHQVKVRLDDEDFHELKDYAHELKAQHSVLAREIILAALAFKKEHGYEDLEIWASEMGVSTDELASQILRKAGRFLSRRGEPAASDNVVQFGPRR
ncbi:hypothetical protein D3C84_699540 [compost metagenome]